MNLNNKEILLEKGGSEMGLVGRPPYVFTYSQFWNAVTPKRLHYTFKSNGVEKPYRISATTTEISIDVRGRRGWRNVFRMLHYTEHFKENYTNAEWEPCTIFKFEDGSVVIRNDSGEMWLPLSGTPVYRTIAGGLYLPDELERVALVIFYRREHSETIL